MNYLFFFLVFLCKIRDYGEKNKNSITAEEVDAL